MPTRISALLLAVLGGLVLLPARASAQASALGLSFPIYSTPARGTSVAHDAKNDVFLVVSAYGNVGARFVDKNGAVLNRCLPAGAAYLWLGGAAWGHFPRVTYSPDVDSGRGGFLVTWHEADSPAGGNAVHALIVSYDSCAIAVADSRISGYDKSFWEAGAAVAYSTVSKKFMVVWQTYALNQIHGQLLGLDGRPAAGVPQVEISAANSRDPSVTYNPVADEFLVAYSGWSPGAWVRAARVSNASVVQSVQDVGAASGTYITDTTYLAASNRYVVVWFQPGGTFGRVVNPSGAPEGVPTLFSSRFAAYDGLSIAYNPISLSAVAVSADQFSYEDGAFEVTSAGVAQPGFGATSILNGRGNFYPRVAASSREAKWMMSTSNGFATVYGQLISATPAAPPRPSVTALTPNKQLPTLAGTQVQWTAAATGGTPPLEYRFSRWRSAGGWSEFRAWGTSNFAFQTVGAGWHKVRVEVRSASATDSSSLETDYFWGRPGKALSLNGNLGSAIAYNAATGLLQGKSASGGVFGDFAAGNYLADVGAGASLYTGDFNGDGLTDFFLYNPSNGKALVGVNTGDGFSTLPYVWAPGWTVAIADFNADGLSDVFLYNPASGAWAKFFALANGALAEVGHGTWAASWKVHTGDFNGDGLADLFLFNDNGASANRGKWFRVLSDASGAFIYIPGSLTWASDWTIRTADFDGNGVTDLFLYRATGDWFKVDFATGTGDAAYTGGRWAGGWTIRVGDFTGDGRDDLLLYYATSGNPLSGLWFIVQSQANGQFAYWQGSYRWATGWDLSVTDYNGDQINDLLFYSPTTGAYFQAVTTGASIGDFTFTTGAALPAGVTLIGGGS